MPNQGTTSVADAPGWPVSIRLRLCGEEGWQIGCPGCEQTAVRSLQTLGEVGGVQGVTPSAGNLPTGHRDLDACGGSH